MLKKAATQSNMKESYAKLGERLAINMTSIEDLIAQTHLPPYGGPPDMSILSKLLEECEDSDFWQNFKKAAPVMFCTAIESD
jgi:hypothetical protein